MTDAATRSTSPTTTRSSTASRTSGSRAAPRGPRPLEPRARRPRLLGGHALRRHPQRPPRRGDLLVRDRRHLARGPRARADRGAQVDDRHGPAAPRRAARADRAPLHAARGARVGGAVRTVTDACSTSRSRGRVRLRPRDLVGDPDAGVRRDPRRPAGGAARDHRDRRPAARQPGPGVRAADRRRAPPPAVLQPGRAGDVRVRPPAGRGAPQGTRATTSSPSSRSSR